MKELKYLIDNVIYEIKFGYGNNISVECTGLKSYSTNEVLKTLENVIRKYVEAPFTKEMVDSIKKDIEKEIYSNGYHIELLEYKYKLELEG